MSHADQAGALVENLGLARPPVALAFLGEAPEGVAVAAEVVPSACAFWRKAETGAFFAPADSHLHCPIGAFVMGLELPPAAMQELQGLIGRMAECGYVGAEEPARIPTAKQKAAGILYGPLAGFPGAPDAVLLWLTPAQAMVWSEAVGGATWGGPAPQPALGRPACAAIPAALDGGPTLSLGCIGMRTFTGIPAEEMLAVIPGERLAEVTEAIARTAAINGAMQDFYRGRLAAVQG